MLNDRSTYRAVPLDESLTPAALAHIEIATRAYHAEQLAHDTPAAIEVLNFANLIRASLQQYVAEHKSLHVAPEGGTLPGNSAEDWVNE